MSSIHNNPRDKSKTTCKQNPEVAQTKTEKHTETLKQVKKRRKNSHSQRTTTNNNEEHARTYK